MRRIGYSDTTMHNGQEQQYPVAANPVLHTSEPLHLTTAGKSQSNRRTKYHFAITPGEANLFPGHDRIAVTLWNPYRAYCTNVATAASRRNTILGRIQNVQKRAARFARQPARGLRSLHRV